MEAAIAPEIDAQYRVLREGAGALERPDRRSFVVSGAEAADYLQGQLTQDVESLSAGEGCYSALLDRKGHIQGDMRVLRSDDALRLDAEAVGGDAILRHLSMYKIGREVTIEEVTDDATLISVIGPAAAEAALGGPAGPENSHRPATVGGVEPVSEEAAEIARVESGRPRFGREMTTATIPQEAGINERAVSFTKGCYIGQETVARLHYRGKPNRHLRGLRVERAVAAGDPVRLGERELGTVGTAVLSPARGPVALAILRREAEPGTSVEVGDGAAAEVVELPF